jgi:hypothetical protein
MHFFPLTCFGKEIVIIRGFVVPWKLLRQDLYCGCVWITIRPVWLVVGGCSQACHFTVLRGRWIKFLTPFSKMYLNIILPSMSRFSKVVSSFQVSQLKFWISHLFQACSMDPHVILLNLISLMRFCKEYISSLCSVDHSSDTSFDLRHNTLFSTPWHKRTPTYSLFFP